MINAPLIDPTEYEIDREEERWNDLTDEEKQEKLSSREDMKEIKRLREAKLRESSRYSPDDIKQVRWIE